jgi:hypothetical protein
MMLAFTPCFFFIATRSRPMARASTASAWELDMPPGPGEALPPIPSSSSDGRLVASHCCVPSAPPSAEPPKNGGYAATFRCIRICCLLLMNVATSLTHETPTLFRDWRLAPSEMSLAAALTCCSKGVGKPGFREEN